MVEVNRFSVDIAAARAKRFPDLSSHIHGRAVPKILEIFLTFLGILRVMAIAKHSLEDGDEVVTIYMIHLQPEGESCCSEQLLVGSPIITTIQVAVFLLFDIIE